MNGSLQNIWCNILFWFSSFVNEIQNHIRTKHFFTKQMIFVYILYNVFMNFASLKSKLVQKMAELLDCHCNIYYLGFALMLLLLNYIKSKPSVITKSLFTEDIFENNYSLTYVLYWLIGFWEGPSSCINYPCFTDWNNIIFQDFQDLWSKLQTFLIVCFLNSFGYNPFFFNRSCSSRIWTRSWRQALRSVSSFWRRNTFFCSSAASSLAIWRTNNSLSVCTCKHSLLRRKTSPEPRY